MKKMLVLALCTIGVLGTARADGEHAKRAKVLDRMDASAAILDEIMADPARAVPPEIIQSARCIAIVPSMVKGAFLIGADYGRGVATCRNGSEWSAPAPLAVSGGSIGLEVGGESSDLVLFVMNEKGRRQLLANKFKLGADVSAAAGPVGRHAELNTAASYRSEVLTYSRARGLFAGVAFTGVSVGQDRGATRALYGRWLPLHSILTPGQVTPPEGSASFLDTVLRFAGEAPLAQR